MGLQLPGEALHPVCSHQKAVCFPWLLQSSPPADSSTSPVAGGSRQVCRCLRLCTNVCRVWGLCEMLAGSWPLLCPRACISKRGDSP